MMRSSSYCSVVICKYIVVLLIQVHEMLLTQCNFFCFACIKASVELLHIISTAAWPFTLLQVKTPNKISVFLLLINRSYHIQQTSVPTMHMQQKQNCTISNIALTDNQAAASCHRSHDNRNEIYYLASSGPPLLWSMGVESSFLLSAAGVGTGSGAGLGLFMMGLLNLNSSLRRELMLSAVRTGSM